MGVLRTVTDLVAQVRQLSDMENTLFVTDTEILGYINDAYREAYQILANSYEDWNVTAYDFASVIGTRGYAVPADFIKLRKVTYVVDKSTTTEREFPLRRENWNATDGSTRGIEKSSRYALRGANLNLFPMPNSVLNYRMYYSAAPAALTLASANVDFQFGLDRFIVLDAAMKCMIKEKTPIGDITKERDRQLAACILAADNRDASEAMQIQDVEYGSDRDWWDWIV